MRKFDNVDDPRYMVGSIDVYRLARALCRYRWPLDPSRFESAPEFWLREALGYARAYAREPDLGSSVPFSDNDIG